MGDRHPELAQTITNVAGGVLAANPITGFLPLDLAGHGVQICSGAFVAGAAGMTAVNALLGGEALGSSLGSDLAASEAGSQSVVIGESMDDRVIPAAQQLGASYYQPPEAPESEWMENNRAWIREQISNGATIYDIGADPARQNYPLPTSEYYQMELNEIGKADYPTIRIDGAQ